MNGKYCKRLYKLQPFITPSIRIISENEYYVYDRHYTIYNMKYRTCQSAQSPQIAYLITLDDGSHISDTEFLKALVNFVN